MSTSFPNSNSEIDLELSGKKSAPAEYGCAESEASHSNGTGSHYWPLTRMSILEGLQNQTQDQNAWERFVDLYGPLISAFCRKRVSDQDASEITQEVFWRIFRYIKGLKYDRSRGSFGGWVGQITRNEIKQHFARKQKESRSRLSNDVLREIEAKTTLGEWEDDYNAWVVSRAMQQVRDEVSEDIWNLFELTTNGEAPQEVAKRLNVKISRVYKARWAIADRLRQLIQSQSDDYPFADHK